MQTKSFHHAFIGLDCLLFLLQNGADNKHFSSMISELLRVWISSQSTTIIQECIEQVCSFVVLTVV